MDQRNIFRLFKRGGITILLFFAFFPLMAQQDAQFTQYMYNGMFYNPAFAGKEGGIRLSALHRTQWRNYTANSGTGGAPVTQLITAQGRLNSKNIGYGLTLVNDRIGATDNFEANLQGAYHKKLNRGTLSVGIYGGIYSTSLNYDNLVVVNPEPTLPTSGSESKMNINAGLGLIYDRQNYYIGLSTKHLNEPVFDFGGGKYDNQLKNHSYLLLGYRFRPIGQFLIEPSFLLKTVSLNNFSYDVSVMISHQDKISGGIAYRGEESVSLILGYSILPDNSLRLGYSFDLITNGLEAKAPSSHELMLRYNLKKMSREVERVIQRTPRFRY